MKPKIAVIVPALNEETRVARVLKAVVKATLPTEVVVVNDGSSDDTGNAARSVPGVLVVDLPQNIGKAGAMAVGVSKVQAEILVFLDADLAGLRPEHVDALALPVLDNTADMTIGVFRDGGLFSDAAQRFVPYLNGQRGVRRKLFEQIRDVDQLRLGIEVALNSAAKESQSRVLYLILHGVTHVHKEQKLGLVNGAMARARMYVEIGQALFRTARLESRRFR